MKRNVSKKVIIIEKRAGEEDYGMVKYVSGKYSRKRPAPARTNTAERDESKKRISKDNEKYRKELNCGGEVKKSKVRIDTEQNIAKSMKRFSTVEKYTDTKIKRHVISDGTTTLIKFSK